MARINLLQVDDVANNKEPDTRVTIQRWLVLPSLMARPINRHNTQLTAQALVVGGGRLGRSGQKIPRLSQRIPDGSFQIGPATLRGRSTVSESSSHSTGSWTGPAAIAGPVSGHDVSSAMAK